VLLRRDSDGMLAIGQPSHAWISGQLARAWGNHRFGHVHPAEELCLAAEQHDVGMAESDLAPNFNAQTGLPHSFVEMPIETHLELWRAGPLRLLSQSRYAALLVSMHGHRLYAGRDLARLGPADAGAVRAFLREKEEWHEQLLDTLRADPATAPSATAELVRRNSDLVAVWDRMSLALCLDWAPTKVPAVPAADGAVEELQLSPGEGPSEVRTKPWPFRSSGGLTVRCEGRRLSERYDSEDSMVRAFAAAPWETLEFKLTP
jgi:hypothetical protein